MESHNRDSAVKSSSAGFHRNWVKWFKNHRIFM